MKKKNLSPKTSEKTLKVILDTSFLFIPSQFNLDIFEELAKTLNQHFEPIILSTTRKELQKLAKNQSKKLQRQATFALNFAQKCRPIEVKKSNKESHDDVIVRVAPKMNCCVATNDKALRKRLRRINVPVIYLRQKSHLAADGAI